MPSITRCPPIRRPKPGLSTLLTALLSAALPGAGQAQATPAQATVRWDSMNLPFIANAGQIDRRVGFYAQTFAGKVFVTRRGEMVYSLPPKQAGGRGWTLVERFEQGHPRPVGVAPGASHVNYIKTRNGEAETSSADTFGGVAMGEVFPGVRVALRAHGRTVEKIYTLAPGADPARIRMSLDGASALSLEPDGGLRVATGNGQVRFSAPVAWQEKRGRRQPVEVRYTLDGARYGYALGDHDPRRPVVIDPLLQATYLGSQGTDSAGAIVINPNPEIGGVYVLGNTVGLTNSFPGTTGGAQADQRNANAAFVAKLSITRPDLDDPAIQIKSLQQLDQATYFESTDGSPLAINGVAVHPKSQDIYLWGTGSPSAIPAMNNAGRTLNGEESVYFVTRLSAGLGRLKQSSHIAAHTPPGKADAKSSVINSVAIHPGSGDLYFSGAESPPAPGAPDALLVRLSESLTVFAQVKTFGGGGSDIANSLAIHPGTGDVYVAGQTDSTDFPGTEAGLQPRFAAGTAQEVKPDAFVATLPADLGGVKQATYLGGTGADQGRKLLFNASGSALYLWGDTASADLPMLTGPGYAGDGGAGHPFFAALSPDLKQVAQSRIAVAAPPSHFDMLRNPNSGDVFAIGDFAIDGRQAHPGVMRFSADLGSLLGKAALLADDNGQHRGIAYAIAPVDPQTGDLYVLGDVTTSDPSPLYPGTKDGFQDIPSEGGPDVYVAQYTSNDISNVDTLPDPFSFAARTHVELSSVQTSDAVAITGIDAPVPISVVGGTYSIGCNGKFSGDAASIGNGQTVCVRHTAASASLARTDTTLTVASLTAVFSSTTKLLDITPEPFAFEAKLAVAPATAQTSNAATISGIEVPVDISVVGGAYSIGCTDSFVTEPGTIQNGQRVCVRHTSATTPATRTDTTLRAGSVEALFSSTTSDNAPAVQVAPFSFKAKAKVKRNRLVASAAAKIRLSGASSASISVVNGQYSIGCLAKRYTAAVGAIRNNQKVCVRHRSSTKPKTTVATELTVGGVSARFASTTK